MPPSVLNIDRSHGWLVIEKFSSSYQSVAIAMHFTKSHEIRKAALWEEEWLHSLKKCQEQQRWKCGKKNTTYCNLHPNSAEYQIDVWQTWQLDKNSMNEYDIPVFFNYWEVSYWVISRFRSEFILGHHFWLRSHSSTSTPARALRANENLVQRDTERAREKALGKGKYTKSDEFLEKCQREGGHFQSKNLSCRFWEL